MALPLLHDPGPVEGGAEKAGNLRAAWLRAVMDVWVGCGMPLMGLDDTGQLGSQELEGDTS